MKGPVEEVPSASVTKGGVAAAYVQETPVPGTFVRVGALESYDAVAKKMLGVPVTPYWLTGVTLQKTR